MISECGLLNFSNTYKPSYKQVDLREELTAGLLIQPQTSLLYHTLYFNSNTFTNNDFRMWLVELLEYIQALLQQVHLREELTEGSLIQPPLLYYIIYSISILILNQNHDFIMRLEDLLDHTQVLLIQVDLIKN